MAHTALIGYGNPLRTDDGVGWHVTDRLRETGGLHGVEIVFCQQLLPELAAFLSQRERVLFVDSRHGSRPGEITMERVLPEMVPINSHHLQPGALLALARVLYGACPCDAHILTITGADFSPGHRLSPPLAAALPRLIAAIQRWAISPSGRSPRSARNRGKRPTGMPSLKRRRPGKTSGHLRSQTH